MSVIPENDKARKMLPMFKQLLYFPKALRELTRVSVVNNVRYNPGREPADINWNREKSTDQLGSAFRHMLESAADGKVFEEVPKDIAELTGIERVYILAEAWWRLGAALELAIEKQEASEAAAKVLPEGRAAGCGCMPGFCSDSSFLHDFELPIKCPENLAKTPKKE